MRFLVAFVFLIAVFQTQALPGKRKCKNDDLDFDLSFDDDLDLLNDDLDLLRDLDNWNDDVDNWNLEEFDDSLIIEDFAQPIPKKKKNKKSKKNCKGGVVPNGNIHTQSPINLISTSAKKVHLKYPLIFENHWDIDGTAKISHNGAVVYLTFANQSRPLTISGGPLVGDFVFEQMHMHWAEDEGNDDGSEHAIDGRRFAGEAHLVYRNTKYANISLAAAKSDGLGVLGFFLSVAKNQTNGDFDVLADGIDRLVVDDITQTIDSDCLHWMLDVDLQEFFTYKGSLTTEPFSESVTWMVVPSPIEISNAQLEIIRNLEKITGGKHEPRNLQTPPAGHRVYWVKPRC